jgi:hypothetical protein
MKAELISEPGAAWENFETALGSEGVSLGLYHRRCWADARGAAGVRSSLVAIRDDHGGPHAAFAVESRPTRALRGHRILAVSRLGIGENGLDDESLPCGLAELIALARADKTVLKVIIDSFSVESDWLMRTGDALRNAGFRENPPQRTYAQTLLLDLEPNEEELLAGLHKSARRNIRDAAKFPVVVESPSGPEVADRLQMLDDETRARTGGDARAMDWASTIRMTLAAPHLSRVSMIRRTDRPGLDGILAYSWACMHGSVAQYSESGSTRADDLKLPLSYVLLWDLIRWARSNGASYFDLGGVTKGTQGSGDPLGGISDFKRRFSPFEYDVAQEWSFEPHPARAATAKAVSGGARLLRQAARHLRR